MESTKRILFGNSIKGAIMRIILLFVIFTFPFFHKYSISFIVGHSMHAEHQNRELVVVERNRGEYKPKRYDVVEVIVDDERWIKRIMGLPGDHIKFGSTRLWVNNKRSVKFEWLDPNCIIPTATVLEIDTIVPPNNVWVIGDNRENSAHALVHMGNVAGKVVY